MPNDAATSAALPPTPQGLIALIGQYGLLCRAGLSTEAERQQAWTTLLEGIKAYAFQAPLQSSPRPPAEDVRVRLDWQHIETVIANSTTQSDPSSEKKPGSDQ